MPSPRRSAPTLTELFCVPTISTGSVPLNRGRRHMTRAEALTAIGRRNAGCAFAALAGHQAASHGDAWVKNPHPHGSALHRAWVDGYRVAIETPVASYRLPGDRRAA